MIVAILVSLAFLAGIAFGVALSAVTPEAGLCFLLMAVGAWDRWQEAKRRFRRRFQRHP